MSGADDLSREPPLLEARHISKDYGIITALDDVSISLRRGEVVGLVGDNGAGKSTLANILCGATKPTQGELLVDGRVQHFASPAEARAAGIEMVYQDLSLAEDLSVADNLFLGREITGSLGWLDRRQMEREASKELERLSISLASVRVPCRMLSGGQRQAIAIARAVVWSSSALLLDEPTAALGVEQQARVENLIREIADRGLVILLISHNLPQVMRACDRIIVLWRGQIATILSQEEATLENLERWITRGTKDDPSNG